MLRHVERKNKALFFRSEVLSFRSRAENFRSHHGFMRPSGPLLLTLYVVHRPALPLGHENRVMQLPRLFCLLDKAALRGTCGQRWCVDHMHHCGAALPTGASPTA